MDTRNERSAARRQPRATSAQNKTCASTLDRDNRWVIYELERSAPFRHMDRNSARAIDAEIVRKVPKFRSPRRRSVLQRLQRLRDADVLGVAALIAIEL